MKLSDFDYQLPEKLIAQYPKSERQESRLLVCNKQTRQLADKKFTDILSNLKPNDLLVLNNTKVIKARIFGAKPSGGKLELLVEKFFDDLVFYAHIKASKAPKVAAEIFLTEDKISATVLEKVDNLYKIKLNNYPSIDKLLETYGNIPLPPYIERTTDDFDLMRYQTVYAKYKGAVAAPTAGLHFTNELLAKIKAKGCDIAYLTLHVGAGTFQPVRADNITEHKMHYERIMVDSDLINKIKECKAKNGKVVAVGTTVVRALETIAKEDELKEFQGETNLFIYPGFKFKLVDKMLTNFHLPKSSLLMLISAFAGHDFIKMAYEHAVANEYRFFSYGDAMLLT